MGEERREEIDQALGRHGERERDAKPLIADAGAGERCRGRGAVETRRGPRDFGPNHHRDPPFHEAPIAAECGNHAPARCLRDHPEPIAPMTPLGFWAFLAAASVGAGFVGSLLGLGGGLLLVPILTLGFGLDIRYAIGASIVSVIATSSGAAISLVRQRLANLRVAMFLELGTTAGALTGAFLAGVVNSRWLFLIFGAAMAYAAITMFHRLTSRAQGAPPRDAIADRLALHGDYHQPGAEGGRIVPYRVTHAAPGLGLMYLAGAASGLLGIGSGALKVPAMDIAMRLPIKVSSATSNFMIGVTAAASAGVYFARGDINPFVAGPVCAGILLGSFVGSRLLVHAPGRAIRTAFVLVLLWVAVQMFRKGLR